MFATSKQRNAIVRMPYEILKCFRAEGGAGAVQLAEAVVEACAATRADPSVSFKLLYPSEASIKAREIRDTIG